jgi:transposase
MIESYWFFLASGCKELQAAGLPISQIALRLGLNRRRLDKWAKLSELPERKRMTPRPGSIGRYRDYLRQRWESGYRNGQMLFDEIKSLGFVGTYKDTQQRFVAVARW